MVTPSLSSDELERRRGMSVSDIRDDLQSGRINVGDAIEILGHRGFSQSQVENLYEAVIAEPHIYDVADSFDDFVLNINNEITTPLDQYNQLILQFSDIVTEQVTNELTEYNTLLSSFRGKVESIVSDGINQSSQDQAKYLEEFHNAVNESLERLNDDNTGLVTKIHNSVTAHIADGFETQSRAFEQADADIKALTDTVVVQGTNIIEDVEEKVRGVATAIRESLPEVAETVMGGVADITSGFPDLIGSVVEGIAKTFGLDNLVDMFKILGKVGDVYFNELDAIDLENPPTASWDTPIGIIDNINTLIMGLPFIGSAWAMRNSGDVERLRYNSLAHVEPTPLDQGSVLESYRRDPSKNDRIFENLSRQGLSHDKIDVLKTIIYQPLTLYENMQLWLRGELTDDEYLTNLRALALSDEDIALTKKLAYPIPPIGDLIRFVVRDVYDPQVVEDGKLKEGFETFPVETARKIGLADEWSEKYWMAHWMLPSLGQGFEMLHRDAINEQQLEALFKAADLAPGYWDPMRAISYRPLTRVDTRRLNLFLPDFGAEEVKRSYLDQGYNEHNAQLMTDFTVAYNQRSRESAPDRDLTKSDIIGMYNDGVFTSRTEALNYLMDIGYDETESDFLLEREDLQKQNKERKDAIDDVIAMAVAGAYSPEAALDELGHHDLSQAEEREARIKLTRAQNVRTKTPSKSDLDNMRELGVLTSQMYQDELAILGYPEKYIAYYLEAIELEEDQEILSKEISQAGKREPRRVTKGQLDSLYLGAIIIESEYVTGLRTLGYRDTDIANFLIEVNLKLDEQLQEEQDRIARGETAPRRERLPSRVILGKMYLKGLIDIAAYRDGLTKLGFNKENIDLLVSLISDKAANAPE